MLASASASSKEQLHTLVEEEEEEDQEQDDSEENDFNKTIPAPVFVEDQSDDSIEEPRIPAPPSRPRPALRPLSLTPRTFTSQATSLPTPSPTPSPRNGLRSLTLSPTPLSSNNLRQHGAMSTSSSEPALSSFNPRGTSSISYRRSPDLPTPEETPTHFGAGFGVFASRGHRLSSNDGGSVSSYGSRDEHYHRDPSDRSLSPSEQHFLHRSHATLLARITELEKALRLEKRTSSRMGFNQGRPVSYAASESAGSDSASFVSAYSDSGPSDEMLRLIADLKAERDELTRDIEGWRVRTADLEKQLSLLMRRVEGERRDAWVAREQVSVLTHERDNLQSRVAELEKENARLQNEYAQAKEEAFTVGREHDTERQRREELERILDNLSTQRSMSRNNTFRMFGRGSESSCTDVEEYYGESPSTMLFPKLKAVAEVEEDDVFSKEGILDVPGDVSEGEDDEDDSEDNELARYEESMDSDESFVSGSLSGSSIDSAHSIRHLQMAVNAPVPDHQYFPSSPTPPPVARSGQLSSGWSFAKSVVRDRHVEPVDRFFGCLDDLDEDVSPPAAKNSGTFFSSIMEDDEDTGMDFVIPLQTSVSAQCQLASVMEEDEEGYEAQDDGEDDDQGYNDGILRFYKAPPSPIEITITEHHDDNRTTTSTLNLNGDDTPDDFYADGDMTITAISVCSEPTTPTTPSPISQRKPIVSSGPVNQRNPYSTPTKTSVTPPTPPSPTFIPQPKFKLPTSFRTPPRIMTTIQITPPSPRKASHDPVVFVKPTMIPQPKQSPSRPTSPLSHSADDSRQAMGRSTSVSVNAGNTMNLSDSPTSFFRFAASLVPSTWMEEASSPSRIVSPQPRRYVSKEKQLEKLARRLSLSMDVDAGFVSGCKSCKDRLVSV